MVLGKTSHVSPDEQRVRDEDGNHTSVEDRAKGGLSGLRQKLKDTKLYDAKVCPSSNALEPSTNNPHRLEPFT